MIEHMYLTAMEILEERRILRFHGKNLTDYVIAGFNDPVTVYHLHLHVVLPPLRYLDALEVRWSPLPPCISLLAVSSLPFVS